MKLAFAAERCSGCRVCEVVCALENLGVINPKKAALHVSGHFPEPARYSMALCDQCGDCAAVCPTDAIVRNEDGVYLINGDDCIGCNICVEECGPGAMRQRNDDTGNVPIKCNLCGKCLEFCPTGALYDADGVIATRR